MKTHKSTTNTNNKHMRHLRRRITQITLIRLIISTQRRLIGSPRARSLFGGVRRGFGSSKKQDHQNTMAGYNHNHEKSKSKVEFRGWVSSLHPCARRLGGAIPVVLVVCKIIPNTQKSISTTNLKFDKPRRKHA